jgi:hypothetical protein
MHGIANHDAHYAKAATEAGQRTQVFAAVVVAFQR